MEIVEKQPKCCKLVIAAKGVAWTIPPGDHKAINCVMRLAHSIFSKKTASYKTMLDYAHFCEQGLRQVGVKLTIINSLN